MLKPNLYLFIALLFALSACTKPQPPSERPTVTLPTYTDGDSAKGKIAYEQECEQCHKLQLGNNKKAPHLLRIYGAKAGALTDYQYSENLTNSQLVWTAENIDRYIANPKQTIPDTKMRTDPIDDVQMRKDIVAYLSTLK